MTVNPLAAALLADQLVGEPITLSLILGLVAVLGGILIATTEAAIVARAPWHLERMAGLTDIGGQDDLERLVAAAAEVGEGKLYSLQLRRL
jgi:hypothetical protein